MHRWGLQFWICDVVAPDAIGSGTTNKEPDPSVSSLRLCSSSSLEPRRRTKSHLGLSLHVFPHIDCQHHKGLLSIANSREAKCNIIFIENKPKLSVFNLTFNLKEFSCVTMPSSEEVDEHSFFFTKEKKRPRTLRWIAGIALFVVLFVCLNLGLYFILNEQLRDQSVSLAEQNLALRREIDELRTNMSATLQLSVAKLKMEIQKENSTLIRDEIGQLQDKVTELQFEIGNLTQRFNSPRPPCILSCQHGGYPSADCTSCKGCDDGWTGADCTVPASCSSRCSVTPSLCLCQNGGKLDSATCLCQCLNGWKGSNCQGMVST